MHKPRENAGKGQQLALDAHGMNERDEQNQRKLLLDEHRVASRRVGVDDQVAGAELPCGQALTGLKHVGNVRL